jgi:type I restriction enzyme S subunit
LLEGLIVNFDNLPDSWAVVIMSDILQELLTGNRPKGGVQDFTEGIPSLGGEHLNYSGGFKFEKVKYVPVDFAKKLDKVKLAENDILIVKDGATTGKTSFIDKNFPFNHAVINEHLFLCRVYSSIVSKYIFYFLYSNIGNYQILLNFRGAAQGGITKNFANNIKIPLPPLNEQKRIVAKIELIQERSQIVQKELERVKVLLKKFRRSLLASAFRGDLTKDWRVNNPDIEPWIHTTLEKIILEKPRNGLSIKAVDYQTNVKSLVLTATTSGIFKPEYFKYLDIEIPLDSYLWLQPKDILIQRSNSLDKVGIAAIYTGQEQEFIYPDIMIKVKVNETLATPKFVHYSLNNIKTRLYYQENATGTAGNMPKINQQTVMNTPISVPPLAEQEEIVRKLEKMMKFADRVEEEVTLAEKKLNQFNQSVLAKAFRGELVAQDPNDEPVSVLLERIQQEKIKTTIKKIKKSTAQNFSL